MPELFITNFNKNFTGVSTTIANLLPEQAQHYDLALVGQSLPDWSRPISVAEARAQSRTPPAGRPFAIWHVRRNTEMRAALWARDVLRLPIRIVFTSAGSRRHSAFPRWLISRMDAVIATSDKAASFVPHVKAVVPHGAKTELYVPSDDRAAEWARLGYGGSFGIATMGRIRPEKGTDTFVHAMISLLRDRPDGRALVIGRTAPEHQGFARTLRDAVAKAGLSEQILFPGWIPGEDMPTLMRSLSLVVQVARHEGFGVVPLEGMSAAVPFVATDTGFYKTFAMDGETGTIVHMDDPEAVARAAAAILDNPDRFSAMAQSGRRLAVDRFSIAREAREINAVYEAVWAGD